MHSWHHQQVRLFVQFLAEILRCRILCLMQRGLSLPAKIKTVTDLLWEVKSIRWMKIANHPGFYKRPTKKQKIILDALNIGLSPRQYPLL